MWWLGVHALAGIEHTTRTAPPPLPRALLMATPTELILSNAHVRAVFSLEHPGLRSLAASWSGGTAYTETLAQGSIRLETEDLLGRVHTSTDGAAAGLHFTIHENTSSTVNVTINGIVDRIDTPLVNEVRDWRLN